jgi:hypothetical protein
LQVEISGWQPKFTDPIIEGDCDWDVPGLHNQHLPSTLNIVEILEELKSTLEGRWDFAGPCHYSYALGDPVFTSHGDLIVQLQSHDSFFKKEVAQITQQPRREIKSRFRTSEYHLCGF